MPRTCPPRLDGEGYSVQGHDTYAMIHLRGALGPEADRRIDAAVSDALRLAPNVLVDMRRVTHVDEFAWSALIRAADRVESAGTLGIVAAPAPHNPDDPALLKLLFHNFRSLDEAVVCLVLEPTPSPERRVAMLLQYILDTEGDAFTLRDLFSRVSRNVFPNVTCLQSALNLVEDRGHVSRAPAQTIKRVGRPSSPRYLIHRNSNDERNASSN